MSTTAKFVGAIKWTCTQSLLIKMANTWYHPNGGGNDQHWQNVVLDLTV